MQRVSDIRRRFREVRNDPDHRLGDTIELIGESFIADEPSIFLKPNEDYIRREIAWYESQSLYVDDIEGETPRIWREVSSHHGKINSNYGYLLYSEENGSQFDHVVDELTRHNGSRRAVAVYTRPSIHIDQNEDGMQDFICTNAVNYELRDQMINGSPLRTLNAVVQMRSNDAVYGYRNDWAWQLHALKTVRDRLGERGFYCALGDLYWQVASLHIYKRHWHLLGDDVREDL